MNLIEKISEYPLHLLFPEICSNCGKDFTAHHLPLCSFCLEEKNETDEKLRCDICGEIKYNDSCSVCASRKIFFKKGFFFWPYESVEKKLFMMAKFENRKKALRFLNQKALELYDKVITEKNMVILGLPSSNNFLKSMTISIAKEKDIEIYFPFSMQKKKQSKTLHAKDRFLLLKDSLTLNKESLPINKKTKYLLFDDVWTTGATLNTTAKVLHEAGVPIKNIFTAAFFRRDKTQFDI
ncbi:MAG: hypothetical protein OEZ13_12435 [Spirochaetia bacterium]|nr:hypothetical protein [Spirochaetia bacterium]